MIEWRSFQQYFCYIVGQFYAWWKSLTSETGEEIIIINNNTLGSIENAVFSLDAHPDMSGYIYTSVTVDIYHLICLS